MRLPPTRAPNTGKVGKITDNSPAQTLYRRKLVLVRNGGPRPRRCAGGGIHGVINVSCRCRTPLLVLSLKLLSPFISLPSSAVSTGLESLNASKTSSSHLHTKFSQLPNLRTFITSSPLNVLAVLALHPSLFLLGHLHHPL